MTEKYIEIKDLRSAIDMIFDHIENDLQISKIRLDHDYHADINIEDKFEILSKYQGADFLSKVDIGLGQLYDDWEFLKKMKPDTAVALMFMHVSPLLKYIAYVAYGQRNGD